MSEPDERPYRDSPAYREKVLANVKSYLGAFEGWYERDGFRVTHVEVRSNSATGQAEVAVHVAYDHLADERVLIDSLWDPGTESLCSPGDFGHSLAFSVLEVRDHAEDLPLAPKG